MRTDILSISVLRVPSGPKVKLASCKSALNPPVVHSSDCSRAVVPKLVLFFVALWFVLRGDLFCLTFCYFVLVVFSPFSIAITSFGEVRSALSAFCTFVSISVCLVLSVSCSSWCLGFVCFLFLLVSVFVNMALPGLFS